MVGTRSKVVDYNPKPSGYGREARASSKRKRKREKIGKVLSSNSDRRNTRARLNDVEDALQITPEQKDTSETSPSILPRTLRSSQCHPTCSNYGPNRHSLYSGHGYYFCHQCDLWDKEEKLTKRISRENGQFKCKANHNSFVFPTDKNLPAMGLYRKTLNPVRRALFVTSMHKGKKKKAKKKKTMPAPDESSEDELISRLVPTINRYSPQEDQQSSSSCCSSPSLSAQSSQEDCQKETSPSSAGNSPPPLPPLQATYFPEMGGTATTVEEIRILNERIRKLQRHIETVLEQNAILQSKLDSRNNLPVDDGGSPGETQNKRFQDAIKNAVEDCIAKDKRFNRWGTTRRGKQLANAFFSVLGGIAENAILKKSKKILRETVFTPYAILQQMDEHGGTLSYEGLKVLRKVESLGKKRYYGGLIPSDGEIRRAARQVERVGRVLCPFKMVRTKLGELLHFDYQKKFQLIHNRLGVGEVAKVRGLDTDLTFDGARLSNKENHLCGGFKVTDLLCRHPITGELLFRRPAEQAEEGTILCNLQRRDYCFPLKMMFCRETKDSVEYFNDMFKFFENCGSDETNALTEGWKPLNVLCTCDMSAQWKSLKKGAAKGQVKRPCHGCCRKGDEWAVPNPIQCTKWCHELHMDKPESWKCFHHDMDTPENIAKKETDVASLKELLNATLSDLKEQSKLDWKEDPDVAVANANSNKYSIHFSHRNLAEQMAFSAFLTDELQLRGLSVTGNLERRRERLRDSFRKEAACIEQIEELEHGQQRNGALFLLMQAIPCILHMENRVGIKVITMLLIRGLSNVKEGILYSQHKSMSKRIEMYIEDVTKIVSTKILGDEDGPAQWNFPYNPETKEIAALCIENGKMRTVLLKLELIVDVSFVGDIAEASQEDPIRWKAALPLIRSAMQKVRSRKEFTNDMISSFQQDVDGFFQIWVDLHGLEGVSNYIHFLGSGHISVYLHEWKNLYRHSQQGWEALNKLIKTFYYRRTQRGGASNQGKGRKSKLLPIARWLQRRAIWLVGYNEDSITTFLEDNDLIDAPFEPVEFEVEGEIPEELPEELMGDGEEDGAGNSDDDSVLGGNGAAHLGWV
jgi:hypothetical protein